MYNSQKKSNKMQQCIKIWRVVGRGQQPSMYAKPEAAVMMGGVLK
jgi:hypothetical protein